MIIWIVFFFVAFFLSRIFRTILLNPFSFVKYGTVDFIHWLSRKGFNKPECGVLNCYAASSESNKSLGCGKSLSMVHDVSVFFRRYNNKIVYDSENKRFVRQRVIVLSNLVFKKIPCVNLTSLSQVVSFYQKNHELDLKDHTRTITLVCIDESSVLLNSRSFKDNISPIFLSSLLCSRHANINIYYTSQRFTLTDKLLRDVTQRVIQCHKIWRFQLQEVYSAVDMEMASDASMVKPYFRTCWFVRDSDYDAYDSYAAISDLQKRIDSNDLLSESEILANRGIVNVDNDAIVHRSNRLKNRKK